MRSHKYREMTFSVAKSAIDNYIKDFLITKNYLHSSLPVIGFYGGEPLLNFQLMEQCLKYTAEEYSKLDIIYTVTSNITLLTKEIITFLIHYNIHLCISLNGNKYENDRLRVFPNGNGSFDLIKKKIEMIKSIDESYLEKCTYSCTFDVGTDLLDLNEFFESKEAYGIKLARSSAISPYFSDWYKRYNDNEQLKYYEQYNSLRESVIYKIINNINLTQLEITLFVPQYIIILNRIKGLSTNKLSPYYKYRYNNCIPGDKRAVNPDGEYLMCEKVNYSRSIGHINHGIDESKIVDIIDEFNISSTKCSTCEVSRMCNLCYAAIIDDKGQITPSSNKQCEKIKNNIIDLMGDIYTMLETNENIYKVCGLKQENNNHE